MTNNLMELIALKEGLHLAVLHNLKPLEVCVDSLEVINMLWNSNLLYDSILNACRSLLGSLESPPIHHTFREQNRVADKLAKQGSEKDLFDRLHIFVTPPAWVGVVFWEDFVGKTFSRSVSIENDSSSSYVFVLG